MVYPAVDSTPAGSGLFAFLYSRNTPPDMISTEIIITREMNTFRFFDIHISPSSNYANKSSIQSTCFVALCFSAYHQLLSQMYLTSLIISYTVHWTHPHLQKITDCIFIVTLIHAPVNMSIYHQLFIEYLCTLHILQLFKFIVFCYPYPTKGLQPPFGTNWRPFHVYYFSVQFPFWGHFVPPRDRWP